MVYVFMELLFFAIQLIWMLVIKPLGYLLLLLLTALGGFVTRQVAYLFDC